MARFGDMWNSTYNLSNNNYFLKCSSGDFFSPCDGKFKLERHPCGGMFYVNGTSKESREPGLFCTRCDTGFY